MCYRDRGRSRCQRLGGSARRACVSLVSGPRPRWFGPNGELLVDRKSGCDVSLTALLQLGRAGLDPCGQVVRCGGDGGSATVEFARVAERPVGAGRAAGRGSARPPSPGGRGDRQHIQGANGAGGAALVPFSRFLCAKPGHGAQRPFHRPAGARWASPTTRHGINLRLMPSRSAITCSGVGQRGRLHPGLWVVAKRHSAPDCGERESPAGPIQVGSATAPSAAACGPARRGPGEASIRIDSRWPLG